MKSKYGISPEDYAAMLERQGGVCLICDTEPEPPDVLRVDHDHETGEVRGLLCNQCNIGLGMFSEDVDTLKRAIEYLARQ